jgi:hypothetical protein
VTATRPTGRIEAALQQAITDLAGLREICEQFRQGYSGHVPDAEGLIRRQRHSPAPDAVAVDHGPLREAQVD